MMNSTDKNIKHIVFLVSCAAVLQIAESMIPHPIPGVRLGLANMVSLVALVRMGFGVSLEVTIFRSVISSFILGTFLSPAFFLSFSAGIASTLVMGLVYRVTVSRHVVIFSLTGISILGSLSHNLTQILVVYFFLIQHQGIFILLPWLGISSVVMGWITGRVASQVCQKLDNAPRDESIRVVKPHTSSFHSMHYLPGNSAIHRLKTEVKIVIVLLFSATVLFVKPVSAYAFLFLIWLTIALISKVPVFQMIAGLKKIIPILLFSFLMPLLFTKSGEPIVQWGVLKISGDGLIMGTRFSLRLILLLLNASLLVKTSEVEDLARGAVNLMKPLKILGIRTERISTILVLSWTSIPELWDRIRDLIQQHKPQRKSFRGWIPLISEILSSLYITVDKKEI